MFNEKTLAEKFENPTIKVQVLSKGKLLHEGIVGRDHLNNSWLVGITKTTLCGVTLQKGQKYISIFRAKES
jgi:hypothetical protein